MNTRLRITGDGLCVKRDRSGAHPLRNWGFSFDDDRRLPCLVLIPLLDQPEKHSDHKTVKKIKHIIHTVSLFHVSCRRVLRA